MQHYQLPREKVKHFVVVIGTIFLLTINMCDRGRTITHLQIPRFHTQVWYNVTDQLWWRHSAKSEKKMAKSATDNSLAELYVPIIKHCVRNKIIHLLS